MRELPILYSTPMVQGKLAGRNTQTRRIMKVQPDQECYFEIKYETRDGRFGVVIDYNQGDENPLVPCPYGGPGYILYTRETTAAWGTGTYAYLADGFVRRYGAWERDTPNKFHDIERIERWTPSIHMPKEAARIWERVESVRVERLQDISPADACDEGIEYHNVDASAFAGGELVADFVNYTWRDDPSYEDYHFPMFANPIDSYRTLWESINGPGSWEANPWVWVIETKILSTTGRPRKRYDQRRNRKGS